MADSLFYGWRNEERHHGRMAASGRTGTTCEEIERLTTLAVANRAGEPGIAGADAAGLYREKPSFCAVGQRVGVHHQTVQRCVERALSYGPLAAIEDRPRPGKEPVISAGGQSLVGVAGVRQGQGARLSVHELWTTRLLARHAREHGPTAGHECLARLVQGTVCKILGQEEIKPHKVRYLSGTSRCRVRAEDGPGSVRLSRGPDLEEGRRQVAQSHQAMWRSPTTKSR